MNEKKLIKISDLARIASINKRTLHYYDEIGLFSPEERDKNGYRYYSPNQIIDLAVILSLKELDMPLKEVIEIINGDLDSSKSILQKKLLSVDMKINKLNNVKAIIERKMAYMDHKNAAFMHVNRIHAEEEMFIRIKLENKHGFMDLIEKASKLLKNNGANVYLNNEYGTMFDVKKKMNDCNTNLYDYFYITTSSGDSDFMKPAGDYLSIIYKGDDAHLPSAYQKIITYSKEKHIQLVDYFYEKTLYETVTNNSKESIIEIQVKIQG